MASLLGTLRRDSSGWTITHERVRVALENRIDFLTLYDLYIEDHYRNLLDQFVPGSAVWDIGANLGAASLMFAQHPNVAHVHAYEPLPATFKFAMRSIESNPTLSCKISLIPKGIGTVNETISIPFTHKAKSAIGLSGIPNKLKFLGGISDVDFEPVQIELLDAAETFEKIVHCHPDSPIFLKLDAEGAEYGIIDRLASTGLLSQIAGAAIEWHGNPGPAFLRQRLTDSGFRVHERPLEDGIGMIYGAQ
jgi:FkbM family methyltransferase